MNRFAELLNRLAYEPARNNKLRLLTDYFRSTPDPERGWALAALTGALNFPHAKSGLIRSLIAERADPVLFELSYDYVGDLSETVALMWPAPLAAPPSIKLVTGGLRVGVSARLAKAAVAALGGTDAQDIELLWPGLASPYGALFAWLEGRGDKPTSSDPAPFRPPMLAHALDDADLAALDPADFMGEW
jgi:DNA ligase 1